MPTHRFVAAFVLAFAASGVAQPNRAAIAAASPLMACAQVANLKLPDVKISDATAVPAATTGAVRAPHCRVNGVIGPEIRFSLLLPDTWNGKFLMGGGGGFAGSVANQAQEMFAANPVVNRGYATVGTDTGHQAGLVDARWALNNLERRVNYGHAAVHRTAEVSKAIIRQYYGSEATRSYFFGCSNGGRQAMMEVQRYPDDFDGVIAGAPAMDFTGIGAQFLKDIQTLFPDPRNLTTPALPVETLKLVGGKIVDVCDATDGVKDGVIDDPRQCKVDVAALPIPDVQKTALKKVYGPTTNRDGVIFPGQPFGGEGDLAGWQTWISGINPQIAMLNMPSLRWGFGTQFFKFFVFNDPSWDYTKYDLSTWKKDTELTASYLNATDPDLSAFKAKGRKLIMWHGWGDAGLSPLGTIKYYDEVKARDPKVDDFLRMFMMPGVLHCSGGPGPDTVDWVDVMTEWVENGKAPDRVVARKLGAGGAVTRTRPLCPYPQHAVYKGSGSTDDEANFVCR